MIGNTNITRFIIPLLVLLVLFSCGDSLERSTEKNKEVNIGRVICGGHLSLAVVEKKFQKELKGFRLNAVQYHDWNLVVKDMLAGNLSGSFILSPLAMDLIRNGFPGKIVLMGDRNGNGFILSKKFPSISDLKGKKTIIAVPHLMSQHNILLHLALKQNSVPISDVSVVMMPPRDMINSLRRGEIDGFMVGEPEGNRAASLDVGHLAAISPDIWKGHMDHVLLLTDSFISKEPQKANGLIDALLKAGRFIETNPKEAALMGEDYTGVNAKVFEEVLTTPPDWIDFSDMRPTMDDITAFSKLLVEMGLWNELPEDFSIFLEEGLIGRDLSDGRSPGE